MNKKRTKEEAGSDFEPFDSDDSSLSTGATPTLGPRIIEATLVPDTFITATDTGVLDDWTTDNMAESFMTMVTTNAF